MTATKPLRFVDGDEPGYTRRRQGDGFIYLTSKGKRVTAPKTIERLNSIALPPAYEQAWYARDAGAHLQATGIDARGRKQYRYHSDFRSGREEEKFSRCGDFAKILPNIRKAVERDLSNRGVGKDRIVAAVVRILDLGKVRVGNTAYARENKSFGATTLRNRHVKVGRGTIKLDYVGKSGIRHRIGIGDARLARIVKTCQDLPGQTLFQYEGDDGELHPVSSGDVNDWLREHGGEGFTAKNFRTWGASATAYALLAEAKGKTKLKPLLLDVSTRLGNTPAVARKSYIHPAIIEAVLDPPERDWALPRKTKWLSAAERGLIDFLTEQAPPSPQ